MDSARKNRKLLLVEDNPLEARLFQRSLSDAWATSRGGVRFDIIHVDRLDRAFQVMETQQIDIILLDATLPNSKGLDNIELIRKTVFDIPIILMTGLDDAALVADAFRCGACDCLIKTRYDGGHIARTIHHAFERHTLRSQVARQAEELNRRESNFQNIITASRDGMIILDEEGVIQFMNPSAEMLMSNFANDQIGQSFNFPIPVDGPVEIDVINHNGTATVIEMSAVNMDWEGKTARLVTLRDISQRKELENEKHLLERRLLESQRLESLGVLATTIVHDFNNLLTAIMGSAGAARLEIDPHSPVQEDFEQIEHSCERAAELCQQMLAYSGGKASSHFKPIDLNCLVKETSTLLRHSISKRCNVDHRFGKALPSVLGDGTQLRQIIMNLVINASEAIGAKNGTVRIVTNKVEITDANREKEFKNIPLAPGHYIKLEVIDDGCGMPIEVQKKIFDPFYSTKDSGRGVGLAAVAQIVKKHSGHISVSSQPKKGTTFHVLLPCTSARMEPSAPNSSVSDPEWRGHGTVLIVDDEKGVRTALSRMLKHLGFQSILAQDGRDGLVKFQANADKIHCVLMDLTMPELDGEEACTELLRIWPNTNIVLMSGFAEEEACRRFADKGLAGFLQKPFTHVEIEKIFRHLFVNCHSKAAAA